MDLSKQKHDVLCIRYPKNNVNNEDGSTSTFNSGDWKQLISNNEKLIISFGPVINEIYSVLKNNNYGYDLINAIYQKPLNLDFIENFVGKYEEIIIFNQYGTENGFNFALINSLVKYGFKGKIISKALMSDFGSHQSTEEGLKEQKMDVNSLFEELIHE